MLTDTEARFARSLSAKQVAAHNDVLTAAGPRYVAGDGEIQVLDYMAAKFAEYGLSVIRGIFRPWPSSRNR